MKKALFYFIAFASLGFAHYAVISRPLVKFHLDQVHNELQVEEAQRQGKLFPGKVDAEQAVTLALSSFFEDSRHIESPLALTTQLALEELGLPFESAQDQKVIDKAKEILYLHLNQYDSEIRFVFVGEEPEHGESVANNWIIRLKIPTLSDHIFWAVVERNGKVLPYNYGFN